jgi:hypothetical protein
MANEQLQPQFLFEMRDGGRDGGGDTLMRCDASAMEPASAAAVKYCRWRSVKRIVI